MGKRPIAVRHHGDPADQPRIGDGVVGGATRAGRDPRRAVAGQAGDAVEARGLNGLGKGHRRQDRGELARQQRLDRSHISRLRHMAEIRLSINPWLAASKKLTTRNS
jgi:hypothetical protein